MRRHSAILVLAVALLAPVSAQAETDLAFYAGAAFDVAVLRPLGLLTTVVGAGLFVPAALLTAPNGLDGIQEAWRNFVVEPAESVYKRPLGDF